MKTLRVLGIGSPFGDDQLGWNVINILQKYDNLKKINSDKLQLICCDRPGMSLLELMRDASTVFLIDAVKTGAEPGTLHRFKNQAIEVVDTPLSSHAFGIADAIKMGHALHDLPLNVFLYGIEIGNIQYQFNVSKPLIQAINTLSKQLESDILRWFQASYD